MSSRTPAAPSTCSGHDDTDISGQLARVVIKDNLVFDINGSTWEGAGIFAQIGGEPRDITFDHNTVMHTGNIVTFYSGSYINASGASVTGGPIAGFVFTNNLLQHNAYGIFGSGQAYGNGTLAYYAPGAVVQRNVMATDKSVASRYPADNQFPVAGGLQRDLPERCRPGLPAGGRQSVCERGDRRQEHRLRLHDPARRRCPRRPRGLRIITVSR